MLGTIWINTGLGLLASVATFVLALTENLWLVSVERAVTAFLIFFLLAFPLRWGMGWILRNAPASAAEDRQQAEEHAEMEQNEAADQNKVQPDEEKESFTPLTFSKIERTHPAEDPTTVAAVIRRLTDE